MKEDITNILEHSKPPATYSAANSVAPQNLFLTSEWFSNFVETVATPSRITPLFLEADSPTRALLAMGIGEGRVAGLTNYYSCAYGIASLSQRLAPGTVSALVEKMVSLPRKSPEIRLAPMLETGLSLAPLRAALTDVGWVVENYFCHGNWTLPVDGRTAEEYFATRSARMRNTIKRKTKKFQKASGSVAILQGSDALQIGLPAFKKVYGLSWKNPEPYPEFIPGLCRAFAPLGLLRIGLAWLGKEPIAAQLWLNYRNQALIYKLAYDERHSELSAGTILTAEMFRHAIDEDKVSMIDYLVGDDPYKRDWMTHRRVYYGISAYDPRSVSGIVARARKLYKRFARGEGA